MSRANGSDIGARTSGRDVAPDPVVDEALAGYVHGPAAATEATARAIERIDGTSTLILVEGISDQIAIETLASRCGLDLSAHGIVVVPIGGAQAIARTLTAFGPAGTDLHLTGLCDVAEEPLFRSALTDAGLGPITDRSRLEHAGFHVCVDDLESELIRAIGPRALLDLFDQQGDLTAFRSLQRQPPWRERPIEEQMARFFGAGARRKSRYARHIIDALEPDRAPAPLCAVLASARGV